jgi:branched-subunit amino acid permease
VAALDLHWSVKAWAMGEELLTMGCTAAWLSWPEWFAHAFASERCSAAVGFKIGSIGLMVLALALVANNRTSVQVTKDNK